MKLRKAELWAIGLTAVFVIFAVGFHTGSSRSIALFTITAETETVQRALPEAAAEPETPDGQAPVNLNTATAEELKTLSGIGDALAGRIIDYRTEHGLFESVEDITRIDGIGSGILEKNRGRLTVG